MTKHKTLHFFWAAFPLSVLILLVPVMPGLAQRSAGKPDSVDTWTFGPNLPGPLVRAVGVFFPANGKFYAVGGRSSDADEALVRRTAQRLRTPFVAGRA